MASYYDTCGVSSLLPSAITGRGDINLLVDECEADLIAHYTRRIRSSAHTAGLHSGIGYGVGFSLEAGYENLRPQGGTRRVFLRYYETDAAQVDTSVAEEQAFLDAMGLELARLIKHRANVEDEDGNDSSRIASESRGRRSVSYRDSADTRSRFPKYFGKHLRPFDLREELYIV